MFAPAVLGVLRLLSARPNGLSREELLRGLGVSPDSVGRALARLLEAGVVEARGDLVVPLPGLSPLAQKMERLVRHINRKEMERDQAMGLVKMLLHGLKGP